eukprot:9014940-Alexandrium_andersonii.AAC.1
MVPVAVVGTAWLCMCSERLAHARCTCAGPEPRNTFSCAPRNWGASPTPGPGIDGSALWRGLGRRLVHGAAAQRDCIAGKTAH